MDIYTAEQVLLERRRELVESAERRARLMPGAPRRLLRVWVASGLRSVADRLDRAQRLQRVV
jgi:hypothetical protein